MMKMIIIIYTTLASAKECDGPKVRDSSSVMRGPDFPATDDADGEHGSVTSIEEDDSNKDRIITVIWTKTLTYKKYVNKVGGSQCQLSVYNPCGAQMRIGDKVVRGPDWWGSADADKKTNVDFWRDGKIGHVIQRTQDGTEFQVKWEDNGRIADYQYGDPEYRHMQIYFTKKQNPKCEIKLLYTPPAPPVDGWTTRAIVGIVLGAIGAVIVIAGGSVAVYWWLSSRQAHGRRTQRKRRTLGRKQ